MSSLEAAYFMSNNLDSNLFKSEKVPPTGIISKPDNIFKFKNILIDILSLQKLNNDVNIIDFINFIDYDRYIILIENYLYTYEKIGGNKMNVFRSLQNNHVKLLIAKVLFNKDNEMKINDVNKIKEIIKSIKNGSQSIENYKNLFVYFQILNNNLEFNLNSIKNIFDRISPNIELIEEQMNIVCNLWEKENTKFENKNDVSYIEKYIDKNFLNGSISITDIAISSDVSPDGKFIGGSKYKINYSIEK
jgi:hypothetical protein